jgi:3-deoxy-manno-octulosonate cytidylyltransferase (CMP-KDO synthetase)
MLSNFIYSIVLAQLLLIVSAVLPDPNATPSAGPSNLSPSGQFRYQPALRDPANPTRYHRGHVVSPMQSPAQSIVVIPARYASTRLPRKMLLRDTGKSLIQHTYEAASRAKRPAGVVIATDHIEIAREVERFGGDCVMTSPDCQSGTDRIAEVASRLTQAELFVNVQGDEPEISADAIDRLVEMMEANPTAGMATLSTPIRTPEQLANPACVKVVSSATGRALYFSRSPIPFVRDAPAEFNSKPFNSPPQFFQHLGLYAYRRETVLAFASLPPSSLEQSEKLEQLRFLQSGGEILIDVIAHAATGIDTAEDYAAFVARQRKIALAA